MTTTLTAAGWVLRITGVLQIIIGLILWTGNAQGLVNIHTLIGLVLVVALWVIAGLALRAGAPAGLVGLAVVWGIGTVALGMAQTGLLVGALHWIIEVLHLLVGLVAIGLGEALGARAERGRPARAAT